MALNQQGIPAAVIADLPAWVQFWATFKDGFLGHPEPNRLVGPNSRDGGWGYLAGGRFRLADDEALIVTIDPAGSYYTGFQIADPWTISPDPMVRSVSLNGAQATSNADGTISYAVAAVDPGLANWIDTTGLTEGWMMLRWQGVPGSADPAVFIRETRVIPIGHIAAHVPAAVPRLDTEGRRRQLLARARGHAIRTHAAEWRAED